jgi:hypothetical protein
LIPHGGYGYLRKYALERDAQERGAEVMIKFVIPVLVILLAGCTSLEQNLRETPGRSIDEVIKRRGNPDEVTPLSNGGNEMTWRQPWGANGENTCTVRFKCDVHGIIQSYSYYNCGPHGSGYGP